MVLRYGAATSGWTQCAPEEAFQLGSCTRDHLVILLGSERNGKREPRDINHDKVCPDMVVPSYRASLAWGAYAQRAGPVGCL